MTESRVTVWSLELWSSIGDSFASLRVIWQCLETFLIITIWEREGAGATII